jgi:predicted ATPase
LELLGAPRVIRGEVPLRLPVKKSLALLAFLALEGRATRAKLASLFWGEADGDAARRNLRRELHRLREAGLADALVTDDDAVAIAGEVTHDARAFIDALESADALPDWRGALMDGFDLGESEGFETWLAGKREDLLGRWIQAAAEHAKRKEAAGDAAGAAHLHARLIELDPLQESHYSNAMRLNFLRGERALALDFFERCCKMLREQLGLEPLPATVALAEQIRAADRLAPLFARSGSRGPARFDAPMVGRVAELQLLQNRMAPVVLIEGEPGVGKTRLAREYALDQQPYLHMEGSEAGRNAALHAIADMMRRGLSDPALRQRLDTLAPEDQVELSRLLPDVVRVTAPTASASAGARQRFLRAITAAVAGLAHGGVLVVDDLHWLDDSSLEVIERLARRGDDRSAVHIVATARPMELADATIARDLVRKLERVGLLQRVSLGPLTAAATIDLVRELSGSRGGELFARRLQQATRGNAFFLLETLRYLFDIGELSLNEHGHWATPHDEGTATYAELPVPPTVQQALVERVERLGPAARRVLEAAALAGDPFRLEDVQPATALGEFETLDGLERALQSQVVTQGEDGAYRYVHDLARSALAAALLPERRRLIHLRLAETLQARRDRPDLIALHLDGAGQSQQAVQWHIAAARAASELFAYREALEHYARALAAAAPEEQVALHRSRIELLLLLHELDACARELDCLEALAEATSRPALAAEAICGRAQLAIRHQRYHDATRLAALATEHGGYGELAPDIRERLLLDNAFALVETARYDEGRAIYERELAAVSDERIGHRAELHYGMANLHTSFGEDAEAAVHLVKAVDLFGQAGLTERRLRALNILAYTEHRTGRTTDAISTMDRALAEAERLQHVALLRNTLTNFIAYHLALGQVEHARRLHDHAMTLLDATSDPSTRARLLIRQSEIALHNGALGDCIVAVRDAIDRIEANRGGFPDFWCWHLLGRVLWWCGDREAAVQLQHQLRASPAYLPTADPFIRFYSLAFAIGEDADEALRIARELSVADTAPAHGVGAEDIPLWRATAFSVARNYDAALALLEPGGQPVQARAFGEHGGRFLALRLHCRAALGLDVEPLLQECDRVFALAPAPVALEMAAAVSTATQAPAWRERAHQLAVRMQRSLDGDARLQACFARRWRAVLPELPASGCS